MHACRGNDEVAFTAGCIYTYNYMRAWMHTYSADDKEASHTHTHTHTHVCIDDYKVASAAAHIHTYT
jgi:hypothetical protein